MKSNSPSSPMVGIVGIVAVVVLVLGVALLLGCVASRSSPAIVIIPISPAAPDPSPAPSTIDAGAANPELYEDIYTEPFELGRLDTAYDFRQPRTDLPIGKAIRSLHASLGNDISGFEIIVGLGSTHVLTCIFVAIDKISGGTSSFGQQEPSYSLHQDICGQLKLPWVGPPFTDRNTPLVEIVTSPNNPTGELLRPQSKARFIIHDAVQEWPVYGKDIRPGQQYSEFTRDSARNPTLPVYSFTKSKGIASSRVGYALVSKEWMRAFPDFIKTFETVMRNFVLCHCIQGERIATTVANLEDPLRTMHRVNDILGERHDRVKAIVERGGFQVQSKRGFPFVWLYKQGFQTTEFFRKDVDLEVRAGTVFNASNEYVRLNIYQNEANFQRLVQRLEERIRV
jgi:histidinol-phosphate/aromatic aminotransferase/cobyric acid decarboxylase-like protein